MLPNWSVTWQVTLFKGVSYLLIASSFNCRINVSAKVSVHCSVRCHLRGFFLTPGFYPFISTLYGEGREVGKLGFFIPFGVHSSMGVYSVAAEMASVSTYSTGYCYCCCSIPPNSNSISLTRFPVQLNRGTVVKLSKHQHDLSRGFAKGFRGLHVNTTRLHLPKSTLMATDVPHKQEVFTVGDFMTRKEYLFVVKPTTMVDEALQTLVANRITGLPVVDDDWKLVGVVSDYDLLALDSISGAGRTETGFFPQVGSTWKAFNELQKLLNKTNGKIVAEVMTPSPLVVREYTNLEDAARLLLETKYRRLPVVDNSGKLVGLLTRGNVIKAALQMKHAA